MASNKKALARQECYMALTAATTAYDDASFKQAFATAYKGSTAERVIEDIKEKHKNEERARCPLRFVPLFRDGSWPGHASYCCCFRQVEIIDNGNLRVEHMTRYFFLFSLSFLLVYILSIGHLIRNSMLSLMLLESPTFM